MARTAESVNAVIKAYDVRGVVGEQIDAEFVRDVGASFARLVRDSGTAASQVVVGHDMRASSPDLSRAFADGVTSQGLDVVHIGLASTDQLYFASGLLDCPGAMFTASHNPAKYNGIKLCRAGAKPVGQDTGLATIKAELVAGVPVHDGAKGSVSERDGLGEYAEFVRSLVDLSQVSGVKIAVDAGNGMGGHTVPAVFEGLPVTVEPLYFELDGTFPNHEANPLDPENLKDLQRFVRETGADIGLAFDGDADRCFVVDENGDPVSPSAVTGLVAERELAKEPGATVIHNLITSRAVPELVARLGGTPVRTRVGHSFIKQQMADTGAIFDGYPRTRAQAEALEKLLAKHGRKLDRVVELQVDEDALVDRITGRFTCAVCGAGYHDRHKTPEKEGVCDKCGSTEFKRRPDDNEETVRHRMQVYRSETAPILPFYEERGIVARVDGMASIEDVTDSIDALLDD